MMYIMKTTSPHGEGGEEMLSVTYVIGITQFVFLTLGLMVLTILVKVSPVAAQITPLAQFLTSYGLCLVLVPLFWMFLASLLSRLGPAGNRIASVTGFGIAVLIGVVFTIAIMRPEI